MENEPEQKTYQAHDLYTKFYQRGHKFMAAQFSTWIRQNSHFENAMEKKNPEVTVEELQQEINDEKKRKADDQGDGERMEGCVELEKDESQLMQNLEKV